MSNNREERGVRVDIELGPELLQIDSTIKALKAISRHAKEATQALRALQKAKEALTNGRVRPDGRSNSDTES